MSFAAGMLLERARVTNMSTGWTLMGLLVHTLPSARLPKILGRFPNEPVRAREELGREPGWFRTAEWRSS